MFSFTRFYFFRLCFVLKISFVLFGVDFYKFSALMFISCFLFFFSFLRGHIYIYKGLLIMEGPFKANIFIG